MNFRAMLEIIKDTLKETLSSKVFYVLLVFSALLGLIVVLFSIEDVRSNPGEPSFSKISFVVYELGEVPWDMKTIQTWLLSKIASHICGRFGVLAAIVITGSFVPRMFQTGTIELYLSRPVRRWQLLLAKYIGGLSFVFLQACWLVGLLFVAFGIRSGIWSYNFLWAIPILTLLFAIVYSFSVLMAVIWKSTSPAIFLTILFWLLCGSIGLVRYYVEEALFKLEPFESFAIMVDEDDQNSQADLQKGMKKTISVLETTDKWLIRANYILPPTTELDTVADALYTGTGSIKQKRLKPGVELIPGRPPRFEDHETVDVQVAMKRPIYTCLGFIVFCLGLASFLFHRKEF